MKPIYDSGGLVPDELMIDLIRGWLSSEEARDSFVLDGFPRTLAQAEALDDMLAEIGRRLDVVLELQVPEDAAIERMLKRVLAAKGQVLLCGTCMDARGLTDGEMVAGARRSTMDELAAATLEADKVLVF